MANRRLGHGLGHAEPTNNVLVVRRASCSRNVTPLVLTNLTISADHPLIWLPVTAEGNTSLSPVRGWAASTSLIAWLIGT